ncbi:hypothetical protein IG193_07600 [Infirmifilum lucidum]|uniref:Uncharacterized protein n=1 Tax=Infirmifilum lucidum TaxID=2776706 RepID=A0A7L9FHX3_9CREN|nr:hypothetical protein [Infirmifilum lucidum]QOJ78613.1 hypothetical protein IG193_07600 [Infirmifilum lucidum]
MNRKLKLGIPVGVALAVFLVLLSQYPLGLQALLTGGVHDVELLWQGKQLRAVTLAVGNYTAFCYPQALTVRNLGGAGLTYTLAFELRGFEGYFELRGLNETLLLVSGNKTVARALALAPGSSASLTVCVKAGKAQVARLVVADKSSPEKEKATRSEVLLDIRLTDWYDNTYPLRIELSPTVAREGYAIFEVTGGGEVYVNGKLAGRIPPIAGASASSILVVERVKGVDYPLVFQVEAWRVEEATGVLKPVRLLEPSEAMGANDRLVFVAYISNTTLIHVYTGGTRRLNFTGLVSESNSIIDTGAVKIELARWGFSSKSLTVNLTGSIAWPYQAEKEYYSDPGAWSRVLLGPVRGIWEYRTSGVSGYVSRAFMTAYSGSNITLTYLWPGSIRAGIALEWYLLSWASNGTYTVEFTCATLCQRLPVKLLGDAGRATVLLCNNYYLSGGTAATPAYYGSAVLTTTGSPLAQVKSLKVAVRNFAA